MEDEQNRDFTIEDCFLRLDEILLRLEKQDTGLEDAFTLCEEGMRLLKVCEGTIEKAEKRLKVLEGEGETDRENPF